VFVEPKRSSRPLGKNSDYTNTDHHRSIAVVRTKPLMTADVAAGGASKLVDTRRKEAEVDKKLWDKNRGDRFEMAVGEISRQKVLFMYFIS
jgi:hypothetical protein